MNKLSSIKLVATCLMYLSTNLLNAANGNSGCGEIKIFKENNNEWSQMKSVIFSKKEKTVLHLEYNSYYTIQISQLSNFNELNNIWMTLGKKSGSTIYELPSNLNLISKKIGMEDYFVDLPFAFVSYTKENENKFTLLIKIKSKEMIK